jgi:hypothetical protein
MLPACGHHSHSSATVQSPRLVSIEVEVYDPITDFVWEGVGVRVVEATVEWAGCTCENRYEDDFFFTDHNGLTFFPAAYLADAEVGFPEDVHEHAVLLPDVHGDQASVLLEVWAPGFAPVFVDVPSSWLHPEPFVSIPFELVL